MVFRGEVERAVRIGYNVGVGMSTDFSLMSVRYLVCEWDNETD